MQPMDRGRADPQGAQKAEEARTAGVVASLRRRLLSGGAWSFASRVLGAFTTLASNILLARLLSPQGLGAYFLAFSLVTAASLLSLMGLDQAVVRFLGESVGLNQFERARRVLRKVLTLGMLGALALGLLYLSFGYFVELFLLHAPELVQVTGLVALWMVVLAMQLLLAETFRGLHDIRLASIFFSLANGVLLTAFLGVLWLLEGEADLAVVILLAVGSNLVSVILAAVLLYRRVASFPSGSEADSTMGFGKIIRIGLPLMVFNMSLLVLSQGWVDLWILSAFHPEEVVAVFGAAARMGVLVAMPILVVNSVVSPLIAQMYAQGRQQELEHALRAAATLAAILAFVALLGFVMLGGPILGLVFGDYYRAGAMALALLSIAQFVNVWVGPSGIFLTMAGHQTAAMVITIAGGLVMIVAGIGLAGPYGATGVAAATAAGVIVTNVSYWLVVKRKTGIWTHAGLRGFSSLLSIAKRAT